MLAGRVGWSGKQIWAALPLKKELGSDITSATVTFPTGMDIYGCGSNFANSISSKITSVDVVSPRPGQNILSLCFNSSAAFFSFNDGIVNLMVNCRMVITFN